LTDAALSPHRTRRRNLQPGKSEQQPAASASSDAIAEARLASKIMPNAGNYRMFDE